MVVWWWADALQLTTLPAKLSPLTSMPCSSARYIFELHCIQDMRRRGLGQHLMKVLEQIAFDHGMSSLILTVFTKNSRARDFYCGRLNYTIDRTSPAAYLGTGHEILSKCV